MATLIKTVKLRFGDNQYECQCNVGEVLSEPTTTEAVTFCGTETFAVDVYRVHVGGFQDWTDQDGICEVIHQAWIADPTGEIDYEVALGEPASAWRSGQCKPVADISFGGTAGDPLAFDVTMDATGRPDEVALAP